MFYMMNFCVSFYTKKNVFKVSFTNFIKRRFISKFEIQIKSLANE